MLYLKIGMPLFVMFLGGIGDTMATGFKYAYSRICCRSALQSLKILTNFLTAGGAESSVSFLSGSPDNL